MSNWSVVVTVKAPLDLIVIFINYYLQKGAKNIYIYLDDPIDFKYKEIIEDKYLDRIDIEICNELYWGKDYCFNNLMFSGRPDSIEDRQKHNTIHALNKCNTKWLLSIDIDEFIYSDKDINDYLKIIPNNIFSLRVKPYEAVYLNKGPEEFSEIFTTPYFKHREKRIDPFFWNNIYPEFYPQEGGLFGHRIGKAFIRTDEALKYTGLHNFYAINSSLKNMFYAYELKLLHFESLTSNLFIQKTINRFTGVYNISMLGKLEKLRLQRLSELYKDKGNEGLRDAYNEMYVLNNELISKGISLNLIDEIDLNKKASKFIYAIQNIHRDLLIYDFKEEQAKFINKNKNINFEEISYIQILFDIEQKIAALFTIYKEKVYYFYLNRFNVLMTYPTSQAMFFNFECIDRITWQFGLGLDNKFFTATPNGEFKLRAEEMKDWELFSLFKIDIA